MQILISWLVFAAAIGITAYLLPGVEVSGFSSALITALVLGLVNAFLRPLLILFTLPVNILTLGLFTFIINALLILLTSNLVGGFHVANFGWALVFSILLTIVHAILSSLIKEE